MAVLPSEMNIVVTNELGDINVTITAGSQGLQGIQGEPGPSGGTLSAIAGVDITLGTIVSMRGGLLYPSDPTATDDVLLMAGIAVTSATEGNSVDYVFVGTATGLSGLTPGPYWVGLNGSLSTSYEAVGAAWIRFAGIAQSSSQFNMFPGIPVLIS